MLGGGSGAIAVEGERDGLRVVDNLLELHEATLQLGDRQKAAALSLLRTVVKNLSVPTKSQDPKYRQIRLSNEKVKARLLPCPSAVDYMKAIGFVEISDVDDGSEYLRIEADKEVSVLDMKASLLEVTNALGMSTLRLGSRGNRYQSERRAASGKKRKLRRAY